MVILDRVYPVGYPSLYGFEYETHILAPLEKPCFQGESLGKRPGPVDLLIRALRGHATISWGIRLAIHNSDHGFRPCLPCRIPFLIWFRVRSPGPCALGKTGLQRGIQWGQARPCGMRALPGDEMFHFVRTRGYRPTRATTVWSLSHRSMALKVRWWWGRY